MLLSRFWYVLLALVLGGATFALFVAKEMVNRTGNRAMREVLIADSTAVGWYLREESRKRSAALVYVAQNSEISQNLAKASGDTKIDANTRIKTKEALTKVAAEIPVELIPADLKFNAIWAIDANGRVVATVGDQQHTEDWELGGYPVVADALHGYIRDDAWVWKGVIYRVVARPVEREAQGEPVGAIVGARIVNDDFARSVTKRTGAAVGFYADGVRVAAGAPEGFVKADLDEITRDLKHLEKSKDYQDPEKGRSEVRVIDDRLGVVYARLPGEAWELGAGYAVGKLAVSIKSPLDFLSQGENADKEKVPWIFVVLGAILVGGAGLAFTVLEHTRPIAIFRNEAIRLAKGEIDVLQPSRFRGTFKKIAADLNDGIDKVVAKGGGSRKAADLEQVLGPLPAQPQMSAFAVPGPGGAQGEPSRPSVPKAPPPATSERGAPRLRSSGQIPAVTPPAPPPAPPADPLAATQASPKLEDEIEVGRESAMVEAPPPRPAGPPGRPPPPRKPPAPGAAPAPTAEAPAPQPPPPAADEAFDERADWQRVYEEFLAVKKQCGEPTGSLTFDKFKGTLQRNKDALVARHGVTRVKFTVYVKDGKAALKASPVK